MALSEDTIAVLAMIADIGEPGEAGVYISDRGAPDLGAGWVPRRMARRLAVAGLITPLDVEEMESLRLTDRGRAVVTEHRG